MAEKGADSASIKQRADGGEAVEIEEENATTPPRRTGDQGSSSGIENEKTDLPTGPSGPAVMDDPDLIQNLQEEDLRDLMNLDDDNDDDDGQSVISISTSVISEIFNTAYGPVDDTEHPTANDRYDDIDRAPPGGFGEEDDMYNDYDIDEDGDDFDEYGEDGGNVDFELYDDEIDDYDGFEDEFGDEDDYEDYDDDDEDEDDEDGSMFADRRSADTEFGGVEMIYPRRMFRGAKNVETVKDCMSPSFNRLCSDRELMSR
jgi:hypothetical protein